jgi:hypothetical protein
MRASGSEQPRYATFIQWDRRNADRECNAFHKRMERIIKLLTVQEIQDETHVQKK